ncbi:MAG TPA: RICIN domain-containing protein [Actinoplanes sp.]|nr:RICIN domain-containing protein [Actinoplanes sp.]
MVLVEAADSCPALTPARLAGQVMAASQFSGNAVAGFSAAGGRGVAGLTSQAWRKWAPWPEAEQTDNKANVVALSHAMCDLVGQLRVVGIQGDQWRLALAAHRVGMAPVLQVATVPATAREYVDTVERYTAWYDLQPQFGGSGDSTPETPPSDTPVTEAPLLPVPDQYVAAVVAAGRICAAVPPARIAAQIMATSAFDAQRLGPEGQQGIAQFLPQIWVRYVPPSESTPWNDVAAVRALGTTMCAMVKENAKKGKSAYPLALAAFRRGDSSVQNKADIAGSEGLTALIALVARYQSEYTKDVRLVVSAAAPSATPTSPTGKPAESSAPAPTETKPTTTERTNQPPIKAADGDGSGRVYGHYFIKNHATGLCVDIPGYDAGPRDGPVNQMTCLTKEKDNQEFSFVPVGVDGDGYQLYRIRNLASGYCIDPPGFGSNPGGTPLSETGCFAGDNQDWRLEKTVKVGRFQRYWIRNVASGLCIDLPGDANAGKNARLQLSACQKNNDQDWALVERSEF